MHRCHPALILAALHLWSLVSLCGKWGHEAGWLPFIQVPPATHSSGLCLCPPSLLRSTFGLLPIQPPPEPL